MPLIKLNGGDDDVALSAEAEAAQTEERMTQIMEDAAKEKEPPASEIQQDPPPGELETPPEEKKVTEELTEEQKSAAAAGGAGDEPTEEEKAAAEEERKRLETDAAAAAEKAKSEAGDETDELEKTIDAIKLKDNAHATTKEHFEKLRKIAKAEHKDAKEFKRQLKEKEKLKLLTPELEKELEANREFRRAVDIEHDPVFTQKFTQGLDQLAEHALDTLKTAGVPDSTAKFIKDNGGALRFRSSSGLMPRGIRDVDGNLIQKADGSPLTHAEFYQKYIRGILTPDQEEELTAIGLEARNLARQRDKELADAKAKGEGVYAEREQQQKAQREDWVTKLRESTQKTVAGLGEVAQRKEIPKNATAEEKKRIEAHNEDYDRAKGIAERVATQLTPELLGEAAVIYAYHQTVFPKEREKLNATIKSRDAEIAQLKEKLDKIKNAGKTNFRGTPPPEHKTNVTEEIDDPEERMVRMMQEQKR